jgi:hypothetical protein
MNLLTILVIVAVLVTIVIAATGVYSMTQGIDKANKQVTLARTGSIILTLWILVLVFYLIQK